MFGLFQCGIFILYFYFIFISYVEYGISGDVVISAEKRNADANVAISFFPRKVDVI